MPMKSILQCSDKSIQSDPLLYAQWIQQECAKVGFDWPEVLPVFEKVREEIAEIEEAIANPDKDHSDIQEEMGDLLFACVNLCRHLEIKPTQALQAANAKFKSRFQAIELLLQQKQQPLEEQNLQTLESLWVKVKQSELPQQNPTK